MEDLFKSERSVQVVCEQGRWKALCLSARRSAPEWLFCRDPPLSAEKHIEIAKDYVSALSDETQKDRLRQHLDKPQWWIPFYQAIQRENLAAEWNAIRRRRIVTEFREALTAAGVPVEGLEGQLVDRIRTTPKSSPMARKPLGTVPQGLNLRTIAATIVQNMSLAELRELRVSLGNVFDALEL